MQAADLLVHPSRHEAAPRVVIEAMASGLPVVATETGGTTEILEGCGRLVPVGDSMSLACGIADLASDPEARRELSEAARLRFRERFLPENHLERIHLLYDRLTGESREWSRAS
jgi:glycosyltransferase involved in cell wall biosynthesis